MANVESHLNVGELAKDIKVKGVLHLHGMRLFDFRLKLMCQIIRFAVWIGGLGGVTIENAPQDRGERWVK